MKNKFYYLDLKIKKKQAKANVQFLIWLVGILVMLLLISIVI